MLSAEYYSVSVILDCFMIKRIMTDGGSNDSKHNFLFVIILALYFKTSITGGKITVFITHT